MNDSDQINELVSLESVVFDLKMELAGSDSVFRCSAVLTMLRR